MRNIDVCLSPKLIDDYNVQGKIVVVVDILRATSCMVTAFAYGAAAIIPVEHVEDCYSYQHQDYIVAAERDGKVVEGFQFGNSPFSFQQGSIMGKTVVITTTNGTTAIKRSAEAEQIIIGSFLNLTSVANYIIAQEKDVIIVCAGWKFKMNLEDTIFAGALIQKVQPHFSSTNDSTITASILYNQAKYDLFDFITLHSSHYKRLKSLSLDKDILFCLQQDIFTNIPIMDGEKMIALLDNSIAIAS